MISLYDIIMRTLIDLPEDLMNDIGALAKREKISRAEAVRRAVREYVATRSPGRPDSAFGIWKSKGIDSLEYENRIRDEWRR